MPLKVRLSTKAIEEFRKAQNYLEDEEPGLGEKFAYDLNKSLIAIERMPRGFQIIENPFRRKPLDKFSYNVYYEVKAEYIDIISIKHQAARPESWKE